jgi:tetratricopeptide (TPR) repeat protein
VNILLIGILALSLAASDEVKPKGAPRKSAAAGNAASTDATEREYEKLVEKDEAALKEIEKITSEFDQFAAKGAPGSRGVLTAKVEQLIEGVRKSYEEFLQRNPKHVDGYLAYGSFLNEIGEEYEAIRIWEKARKLDPKNPAAWNNLANVFGHRGPIKKAFQYYEKAIELDPKEPVYLQNLATTVYLFRKDAVETYRIDEQQVFDKALDLYRQAMKLDPTNLVLATDYAQSYYGIQPPRVEDALKAWNHCLTLAKNDVEKEGLYLHLARVELNSGRLDDAQKHLSLVKDPAMDELKNRLQRNLERKKSEAAQSSADEKKEIELSRKD